MWLSANFQSIKLALICSLAPCKDSESYQDYSCGRVADFVNVRSLNRHERGKALCTPNTHFTHRSDMLQNSGMLAPHVMLVSGDTKDLC